MAKLEALADRTCPVCSTWPLAIDLQIVEEIIEVGQSLPAPDARPSDPAAFGPCRECGRVHRARVVALVEEE
jgi:hypothetical protein